MAGRVLRVITRLNRGGPLRQLEGLVPALAERGWTGPVLAGKVESHETDGAEDLRRVGVWVVGQGELQRGIDAIRDARALENLTHWIRRWRPDVVHTHLGKAGLLGRIAAWRAGVPAVHTYHGHHLRSPWPSDLLARRVERWLGRRTTFGLALTPRQARDLVTVYRVLPARKVRVVAPGLDVAAVRERAAHADRERLRQRLAPGGEVVFLWAGRFVGAKDPVRLVEAVKRSQASYRLVLLGDGPLRESVRARVAAAGLGHRILCPGPVPDAAPWIAASDAVVLCSRTEGASMLALEAKALGRPVVTTTVGGMPDVVRHGQDGLWVPPADARLLARALDRLAEDGAERARLGRAAARGVEASYGAARLADDLCALYEEVRSVARSRGRRWGTAV